MDWAGLAAILFALVLGLTLHEFAHALMGTWLGDDTARLQGRLTLNPAAHIDPLMTLALPLLLILAHSPVIFGAARPVPFNPGAVRYGRWGAALVAAAGPLTNLLLAVAFALWLRLVPLADWSIQFLVALVMVNVALGLFNLIPFPPLDGSRVLYAAAPIGLRQIMDTIERHGMMAVALFLLVGYPVIGPFMATAVRAILNVLIPGLTSL